MFAWFKETLPIKRKLQVAFHFQVAIMIVAIAIPMIFQGQLNATSSASLQGILVISAALLASMMRRAMADPYVATVVRMEALAAGDLTSPIAFTQYRDCVGRLTKAMHSFQAAAHARIAAESQADALRASSIAEREKADAERVQTSGQQKAVVGLLATGLSRLAAGDLTHRLEQPFAAEYESLRTDFNSTVDHLRVAMSAVMSNTDAIRSGTQEIAQASDDLCRRTEQQAASLEQTAAALDEITATVKRTADSSIQAQAVVASAKQDAEHTSGVVRDAVNAMGKIDDSSRQIGQIIGVIDEMAFQTNLLALNAGVEAARAGEAGRGFAVVASEVRALAQRSAEASKEIRALVSASDTQVKSGVGLVADAGKALARIIQQVVDINRIVSDIAASAGEQAIGLAQVNTAVNQMDQVTQQNAAMVEQATAASHSLMQETNQLVGLMGQFSVGVTENKPLVQAPARAKAPPKLASQMAGARPTRNSQLAAASWEEF